MDSMCYDGNSFKAGSFYIFEGQARSFSYAQEDPDLPVLQDLEVYSLKVFDRVLSAQQVNELYHNYCGAQSSKLYQYKWMI